MRHRERERKREGEGKGQKEKQLNEQFCVTYLVSCVVVLS